MIKKSLIASAALICLAAAGTASAQNVTLYGNIDLSVGQTSTGGTSNTSLLQGVSSASRLGFKGGEVLADGNKAFFQLEGGFRADTGTSTDSAKVYNRIAIAGLETNVGTVRLGRDFTPIYHAMVGSDALGEGHFGNNFNFGAATNADNGIFYTSPSFSGVTVSAHYGFGNETGALMNNTNQAMGTQGGRSLALGVDYAHGPVAAHLATLQMKAADGVAKADQTILGGSFDAGVAKVFATVYAADMDGGSKTDAFSLGVKTQVGPGVVTAQVARVTDKMSGMSSSGRNFALAYDQPLSKRTTVYTTYGQTSNDSSSSLGLASGGDMVTAAMAGAKVKGFAVGVKHSF